jgi:hypothetical protein
MFVLGQETLISRYTDYGTDILQAANKFSGGGYQWGGVSGVCIPLMYQEELIKNFNNGDKTHCSGFTLSIAFIIASNRGLFMNKDLIRIKAFASQWYSEGGINGKLCVDAIKNLGIGKEIPFSETRSGDFCQIWRTNGSGHTVIFINYIYEDSEIIGIKYRSSQKSTNGIGNRIEYFSDSGRGIVDKRYTFFARLDEY